MSDIRSTYEKFLRNEVTYEQYLSLELEDVDRKQYESLLSSFRNSSSLQSEMVESFVNKYGHLPSCLNYLEISNAFRRLEDFEASLNWAVKALDVAPAFDFYLVSHIFANIAYVFYKKNEYDEAIKWAEIGIKYNPFEPKLISILCKAYYQMGNKRKAQRFYEWLVQNNFDERYVDGISFDSCNESEVYIPSIKGIIKTNREDLYKIISLQYFLKGRSKEEKLINHALCLISSGIYDLAFYTAHQAFAISDSEFRIIAYHIAENLSLKLSRNEISKIIVCKDIYSKNEKDRLTAMQNYFKQENTEVLYKLMNDASPNISIYACKYLIDIGERGFLHSYLSLFLTIEKRLGRITKLDFDLDELVEVSMYPCTKERSVELVERVIRDILEGISNIKVSQPVPVVNDVLENLRFSNGKPVPPSLKHLLQFDCSWFLEKFQGVYSPERVELQVVPLTGAYWRVNPLCAVDASSKLPDLYGDCIIIDKDDNGIDVLFTECPNEKGEYPVLYISNNNEAEVELLASGFDIWLAMESGIVTKPYVEMKNDMKEAEKRLDEIRIKTDESDSFQVKKEIPLSELVNKSIEIFLNNNITTYDVLGLDYSNLDSKKMQFLLRELKNVSPNNVEPLENFIDYVRYVPHYKLFNLISEQYLNKAHDNQKALEWALKALEVTPNWDPYVSVYSLQNLAKVLFSMKEYELSIKICEKAQKYNPCSPSVIGLLCKAYSALNQENKAYAYFRWLSDNEFSPSYYENYLPSKVDEYEPYDPSSIEIVELDEKAIFDIMSVQNRTNNRKRNEKLLNHANALFLAKKYQSAYFSAKYAYSECEDEIKNESKLLVKLIKKYLSEIDIVILDSNSSIYSIETSDRYDALRKSVNECDIDTLWFFAFDPVNSIRILACRELTQKVRNHNLSVFTLHESDCMDYVGSAMEIEQDDDIEGDFESYNERAGYYGGLGRQRNYDVFEDMPEDRLIKVFERELRTENEFVCKKIIEILTQKYSDSRVWKDKILKHCVLNNNIEFTRILLELGADPNIEDNGWTLLRIASSGKDIDIVRQLIAYGADINKKDKEGMSPLSVACEEKRPEIVRILLDNGAEIGNLDLHYAAEIYAKEPELLFEISTEICKMLIEFGADVNAVSTNGETALFTAIRYGNMELVKVLIENGADVNAVNSQSFNCLQYAWINDKTDIYRLLIDKGVNRDYVNNEGWSMNDLTDETGLMPKLINVKFYSTNSIQKLKFRLKVYNNKNMDMGYLVSEMTEVLEVMAQSGLTASDSLDPRKTYAEWSSSKNSIISKGNFVEIKGTYKVRAVSEDALSMFIKLLSNHLKLVELEIISDMKNLRQPDVDSRKAYDVIAEKEKLNLKSWDELPFELKEKREHGICQIVLKEEIGLDDVRTLSDNILKLMNGYYYTSDLKNEYLKIRKNIKFDVFKEGKIIKIGFSSFEHEEVEYIFSKKLTRALFINALTRLSGENCSIEKVVWNLF